MSTVATGLVTWIRCFHCGTEVTVIGPACAPTVEYPGWRIDTLGFYNPSSPGHQCPDCQRRAWTAYCGNLVTLVDEGVEECTYCLAYGGIIIDVPKLWEQDHVVAQLHHAGVLCRGGNEIFDVESIGDRHYDDVQSDVAVRL